MKNEKAFTMIEMLGVVIILVLISLFTFPAISLVVNNFSENKYNGFVNTVSYAAEAYIETNFDNYNNGDTKYIGTKTLIEEGFLKSNIVNPKTKKKVSDEDGVLTATKNADSSYDYNYIVSEYVSISNIEDLVTLSNNVIAGTTYAGKIVILNRDLDFKKSDSYSNSSALVTSDINGNSVLESVMTELTTLKGFKQIGDATHTFKGTFIGNGYTIENLYISRTDANVGLFSVLDAATIKDLTLNGSVVGASNVGLLSGKAINSTVINNIKANSNILFTCSNCGDLNIGGLVGYLDTSKITNATVSSNINADATDVGGLVGHTVNSELSNIEQDSAIFAYSNAGGLVGNNNTTKTSDIDVSGRITGTQNNIGGAIGIDTTSTLTNITSSISTSGVTNIGGIVGSANNNNILCSKYFGTLAASSIGGGLVGNLNNSILSQSYTSGIVSGTSTLGGLVGSANSGANVYDCFSIGKITGSNIIGGLVGLLSSSTLKSSYISGTINVVSASGAIVGNALNSTINYTYFNSGYSSLSVAGSNTNSTLNNTSGLTDANMRVSTSFPTWDFVNIWSVTNSNYPQLISKSATAQTTYNYSYTGSPQTFIVPITGYYRIELWGAESGKGYYLTQVGGKGAYTSGEIYLTIGTPLYVYVGSQGEVIASRIVSHGGYNGGGDGVLSTDGDDASGGGGGATDIRLVSGAWNDATSLKSRIMVAAGAGGGHSSSTYSYADGSNGGTLAVSGLLATWTSYFTPVVTQITGGSFGIGSVGLACGHAGSGGGGGYYGGYSQIVSSYAGRAAGGSSFISGYAGANAITSASSLTPTYSVKHYSGKYFVDGAMQAGVNSGNGKAIITYLDVAPIKTNANLNSVRYIKDCINGNSVDGMIATANHWVELQAIKDGVNLAKGKTVTGTSAQSASFPYSRIVDGDITPSNYARTDPVGLQCITVDLGQSYSVDEIAVWHYFADSRTYNNNVTYVSTDNTTWQEVINTGAQAETANGKRVSAY